MPTSWRCMWQTRRQTPQHPQSSTHFQQIILTHKYVVALFAFLVSVDLIEIVAVLCYQLFTASYFPWHLYPMMLNRAVELVAFICSRGYIPSLYSLAQIMLSLLSLAVYATRQPCKRYNCAAPLALYSILLSYQTFVAIMIVKVSRMPMADDEGHIIANWPTTQVSPIAGVDDHHLRPLGIQIIGLSPRAMRARIINQVASHHHQHHGAVPPTTSLCSSTTTDPKPPMSDLNEIIYAVQQPDGEKLAIARVCKDLAVTESNLVAPGTSGVSLNKAAEGHRASYLPIEMSLAPPPMQITVSEPNIEHPMLQMHHPALLHLPTNTESLVTVVTPSAAAGKEITTSTVGVAELSDLHDLPL
ncbi:unnamed protein product [Sphagnum jensenii]|uniref:Uncharacterized protein n=1 Tax=Sphagnum jensenii TaxID=128206 RepID=A0ABP0XB25_9BRYO